MEAEDAGCTEAAEHSAVADMVDQPPLLHAAVAARRRHRQDG